MLYVNVRGDRVPALGLGTGQLRGRTCYRAVRQALELGYRHLDTAQFYDNEQTVGRAVRDSGLERAELFVTTKVWRTNVAGDRAAASAEESLRRLGTGYVDLLLVHWPVEQVPLAETMAALRRVQEAGLVRHLGVSNFRPDQVREARRYAPVACAQVEYHPLLSQEALLRQAAELDFMVTAYSPTAQGAVGDEPVLRRLARERGRTPVQIALRWLVQQPRVAAIPRSHNPGHLATNLTIFDFTLSPEEMREIGRVARRRGLRLQPLQERRPL